MAQRVNITYSLDVEELPAETLRLWTKACEELNKLSYVVDPHTNAEELFNLNFLDKLASIRETLGNIDFALSDLHNIVNGFMHYQTQLLSSAPEDSFDELAQKIKNFQEQERSDIPE